MVSMEKKYIQVQLNLIIGNRTKYGSDFSCGNSFNHVIIMHIMKQKLASELKYQHPLNVFSNDVFVRESGLSN